MTQEFDGPNRRNGDRFLFEQLGKLHDKIDALGRSHSQDLAHATRILGKEMNEQRERHHKAITELTAQAMKNAEQWAIVKVDMENIKNHILEHTHPEILLKQEALFDALSKQIADIREDWVKDQAEDEGAGKTRMSIKGTISWVLAGVVAFLTTVTLTIGLIKLLL